MSCVAAYLMASSGLGSRSGWAAPMKVTPCLACNCSLPVLLHLRQDLIMACSVEVRVSVAAYS